MRRLCAVSALALVGMAWVVAPATAGTTAVPVSMTFVEVLTPPVQAPCPDIAIAFNCGTGNVIPFGAATEEIAFGEGCGGTCDFREVNVAGGTLFLDETASNFSCPGACGGPSQSAQAPIPLNPPLRLALTDVVVGGTGNFAGASGTLTGSATISGPAGQIKLSGTVTLDP
jgi:hypothetical protein